MANQLSQNPIILTGTMATSYKAATSVTLGTLFTVRVHQVRWRTPQVVGDIALVIEPQGGVNLLRLRCMVAGQDVVADWSAAPRIWRDFVVDQLDSGELFIYTC